MGQDKGTAVPGNVVRIDEQRIQDHLGRVVRGTVEDTLNALLDAEADQLCNAKRYERTDARRDTRAGTRSGRHLARPFRPSAHLFVALWKQVLAERSRGQGYPSDSGGSGRAPSRNLTILVPWSLERRPGETGGDFRPEWMSGTWPPSGIRGSCLPDTSQEYVRKQPIPDGIRTRDRAAAAGRSAGGMPVGSPGAREAVPAAAIVPRDAGMSSGGMPVQSLGLPGMIPVPAISFANSDVFRHASPLS
jgi:hypothetical protein